MTKTTILGGLSFVLLTTVPAWAADYVPPADEPAGDLCAVSALNGKIHAQGGVFDADDNDSEGQFQGVGSLSLPLGCMFGAQVDAGAGKFGDFSAVGIGGHLFMRDPSSHLFGIHATFENWDLDDLGDDVGIWRVGPEVELYLANISLEAWAGFEDGEDIDSSFFARLTAGYYVYEDLRLGVGWRHSNDIDSGVVNAEWQLSAMPLSLTAEAEFGENDFTSVMGGVKFYFGGSSKSLIDRHRQDDPADGLFDFLGGAAALGDNDHNGGVCQDEVTLDGNCTDGCCTDTSLTDGK
jgi:hypothetical protein